MRLVVVVEGQTEEAFVKEVLAPHLWGRGVHASATIVGKQCPRFDAWVSTLEALSPAERA